MNEVPRHLTETILTRVRRDLDPSPLTVLLKTGVAIVLGGIASLFVCGQYGLGITGFAQNINLSFHHHTGSLACAVICGSLFAIIPVLVLRFMCSAIQFRVIIRKKWQAPVIWLASFGGMLAYHGEFGNEFVNFLAWTTAAYFIYLILGLLMDQIQFSFHRFVHHN